MSFEEPDRLIHGQLDGSLSPAEEAELNEWIKADPANADRFALEVRLHNEIYSHYKFLNAALAHIEKVRTVVAPRKKLSRRWVICTSIACLLLVGLFYVWPPAGDEQLAIGELRELMNHAHQTADRVYRVTFVREKPETPRRLNNDGSNGAKPSFDVDGTGNEAILYIRDGRQFVFVWTSVDGRRSFIGSDGKVSWAIRADGEVEESNDRMHFTAALPGDAGRYLVPILGTLKGQENVLIADYNLEVRHLTKTTDVLLAGKKPETKQGPRRIEVTYSSSSKEVAEMRIIPEIPDRRQKEFTLLALLDNDPLPPNWFTWECHATPGKVPVGGAIGVTG